MLAEVQLGSARPLAQTLGLLKNIWTYLAATLSLLAGENYLEVAAALGHNLHTMHKHYAQAFQDRSVFVEFE